MLLWQAPYKVCNYKNAEGKVEQKYLEKWNWKEQKHTAVAQFTG